MKKQPLPKHLVPLLLVSRGATINWGGESQQFVVDRCLYIESEEMKKRQST